MFLFYLNFDIFQVNFINIKANSSDKTERFTSLLSYIPLPVDSFSSIYKSLFDERNLKKEPFENKFKKSGFPLCSLIKAQIFWASRLLQRCNILSMHVEPILPSS